MGRFDTLHEPLHSFSSDHQGLIHLVGLQFCNIQIRWPRRDETDLEIEPSDRTNPLIIRRN